jgi:fumarate reductase subunit C
MSGRLELWLFIAQRVSAMILAPLVIIHLVTIIYAIQDGLTAAEILARTKGSLLWGGVYGLFVVAAAVHGSIGLRVIFREWTGRGGAGLNIAALLFGLLMLVLGLRAVGAVT